MEVKKCARQSIRRWTPGSNGSSQRLLTMDMPTINAVSKTPGLGGNKKKEVLKNKGIFPGIISPIRGQGIHFQTQKRIYRTKGKLNQSMSYFKLNSIVFPPIENKNVLDQNQLKKQLIYRRHRMLL